MAEINFNNITVDNLSLPLFDKKCVEVSVLRIDKIHPLISGNKWFKLRYYFEDAKKQGKKTILTFGGPWSNHILATAAACKINGFNSIGIIRGEQPATLSPILQQAIAKGMQLVFVTREEYKLKKIPAAINISDNYLINEGGYGELGVAGAATILDFCNKQSYTTIGCACGTGTMVAGIINSAVPKQEIIGISVLKNNLSLQNDVQSLLQDVSISNFKLLHDYHFGGYAKHKPALIAFMNKFYLQTNIPSDFVYTGKLFFAIHHLVENNFFNPGSKLLLIHSGGLTGNSSLEKRMLIF